MSEGLSQRQVDHVAKLARLRIDDDALRRYAGELSAVLQHIDKLRELDVREVEPLAHPHELTNRLDEDEVEPSLPIEAVRAMAPAMEGPFFTVSKVLGGGEAGAVDSGDGS